MQDRFDQKKESILKEIGLTSEETPDASPKGTIDEFCLPIINLINSDKDMVTTSSCSGRVSVFLEGIKNISENEVKIGSKGNYGQWIFVTHDPKDLPNWYKSVQFKYQSDDQFSDLINANTRYILFKFEPLILHVKCRDLKTANSLYTTAMNCGFRESGVGSNNIVAIRISIKLDIPIGYLNENDELVSFVTEDYLNLITKLSLDRFKENFKKLDQLHKAIEKLNISEDNEEHKVETKEERKQRKIREGLSRREAVRAEKDRKKKEKLEKEQEKS